MIFFNIDHFFWNDVFDLAFEIQRRRTYFFFLNRFYCFYLNMIGF